ncbi:MAG: DUF3857 domain-containing protein [Bacteroidetes bacterium]|nr:DUF3857 domain-containing protein [Bacteroidota bacterium]
MNLKPISACLCIFFFANILFAQEKTPIKFGKISMADFDLSQQKYDSGAAAVVIADVGFTRFEGNQKGSFSLNFTHFRRAKIINKNGFDIGTVEIPLYKEGQNVEKLINLKAYTYNLENGKIVTVKLDDKSVFTDQAQKNYIIKKFTFPALKEGSIIEFSYTQTSDFLLNLQPWAFQGAYPRLWSEYEVVIPEYFNYVTLTQGYQPFAINTKNSVKEHYRININNAAERSELEDLNPTATDSRYVMRNVPALKEENYTTTLANHIAKIEFQLSNYQFPNSLVHDVMGNWLTLNQRLLEDDQFGAGLNKNNAWMSDDVKSITNGAVGKLEKARKIFAYVRDHFSCTDHSSKYIKANTSLKDIFKNKTGNDAEINLLLTAMLLHEDIPAYPVILSKRSNGKTNEIYPLLDRYDYVISMTNIDGTVYFLDASQPKLGFGQLAEYCYNGHARIISKEPQPPIFFEPDSLTERKLTSVFITNDDSIPNNLTGRFQSYLGSFESYDLRNKLSKRSGKDFFKELKSPVSSDMSILSGSIDSLDQLDNPISIQYGFVLKNALGEDMVYFNPMLGEAYKENPFKALERKYPVEMPYASDETYILNFQIPSGYEVNEIPKSAKVLFNETEGFFEYLVVQNEDAIQLRSRIKLNKANFMPEDYNTLRDFFAFIVKKQSEQIVLKKKK